MSKAKDLSNVPTNPSGFRNAIINGDFRVWQRSTSSNITASTNTFVADRFSVFMDSNAGTVNYSRQAFTAANYIPGNESLHFARISTGGNCNLAFAQTIEGVETFAGKTITVSFWARTSVAKTFTVLVRQHFGTSGSANVDQSFSYTTSTSWQRFTFNVTLSSISGKTIGANSYLLLQPIQYAAHTGNFTYDIWGVQVEAGFIATPFEQRPIGTELRLCQRYYQMLKSSTFNSPVLYRIRSDQNNYDGMIAYYVEPRSGNPTYTVNSPSNIIHKPAVRWDTISSISFSRMGTYLHINCVPGIDDGSVQTGFYLYGIDIFHSCEF